MSDRKSRFNLFGFNKKKNNLNWSDDDDDERNDLSFPSFESIIPENSPLKNNSNSSSGFYNDQLNPKDNSSLNDDLDGVDEKYGKYIFFNASNHSDFDNSKDHKSFNDSNGSNNFNKLDDAGLLGFDKGDLNDDIIYNDNGDFKERLLGLKKKLLNKNNSSKNLFGKITFILIFLVLASSIFYFFAYQPFQNELNLEKNSKLNEINTLYRGPLEINENAYSLKDRINRAYDIEEIKSIDVLMFATKDWRTYHSSKIVSCRDNFGRVMMSYGENKNIIMSVKDANDFVHDNDARILSNVHFEKVNTVIVPISISRLQATGGLISVGSVVDIYSLSENSTEFDYMNDEEESMSSIDEEESMISNDGEGSMSSIDEDESMISNGSSINDSSKSEGSIDGESLESDSEGPLVSGATVLAILRSKDSGVVDSAISRSNTLIKGNQTNPFENTSSYSSDVEEQLKAAVLNSNNENTALDSFLVNYGVRLSNFERMSNLGDLDSEYIILLEVPQGDVNFVINNMENLILTIPTDFAPNWVIGELNETYYENLYQEQSLDFF